MTRCGPVQQKLKIILNLIIPHRSVRERMYTHDLCIAVQRLKVTGSLPAYISPPCYCLPAGRSQWSCPTSPHSSSSSDDDHDTHHNLTIYTTRTHNTIHTLTDLPHVWALRLCGPRNDPRDGQTRLAWVHKVWGIHLSGQRLNVLQDGHLHLHKHTHTCV